MFRVPVEPPITDYLHNKAVKLHIPLSGTFELTPLCNMDCRMCYVRMSRQQQEAAHPLHTASDWLQLAETARSRGMLYLLLTGGEPFLRPDFREILTQLHYMGLMISINSNGTLIDESVVRWLQETPPLRINLTIYGASDATYARLCRNPKGFTQVSNAIRLLKAAGISIKLNCSITNYNVQDLEEIFAFARQEELLIQPTSYMFPPLRRDASMVGKNDRFSPEEAAYYAARIECLQIGEAAFMKRMQEQDFASLPDDTNETCTETVGEGIQCRAGKSSFWVTWDGRLLPCGMLSGGEDVFALGFDEAWRRASEVAAAIRLPARCKSCGLKVQCRACAAMTLTESGCFHQVPEYRCRMVHAYSAVCKRLKAELLAKE